MIKVFLHISVHIGTKLSELGFFPGQKDTQEGEGAPGIDSHGGWGGTRAGRGNPLSETSPEGESRVGQGR